MPQVRARWAVEKGFEMAEKIVINAETRTAVGKGVGALRRSGKVPGVVYGHGIAASHIQMDAKELTNTLRKISRNRLITLEFGAGVAPKNVLTREVQRDPVKRTLKHVDFYEVSMTEKITVRVPVVYLGESADVKGGAGILNEEMNAIEIRCLPADLIEKIEVDVSGLSIDQSLHVSDLKLPAGIEILDDQEDELVRVIRYVEQKAEEAAAADGTEPEVIEKGKKDEEAAAEKK